SSAGKSLNTRRSELVVAHEHIAYGVDEAQDNGQWRKEIEHDQEHDAPAYLALIEAMGAQPAQENSQYDRQLPMAVRLVQFIALVSDNPHADWHRQRQGDQHFGRMNAKVALDGVINIRKIMDDQAAQVGQPGEDIMGDRFAEGQRKQDDNEYR